MMELQREVESLRNELSIQKNLLKLLFLETYHNAIADNKKTSLHFLCEKERFEKQDIEIIKNLVEYKMDVNQMHQGKTPLHLLCSTKSNSQEIIKFIIERKADSNLKDPQSNDALLLLSQSGKTGTDQVVEIMLEKKCNPNNLNQEKKASIHYYFQKEKEKENSHKKIIFNLIKNFNADTNLVDDQRNSPLHNTSDPEMIEFLLENKANPNQTNNQSNTPFHYLAKEGNEKVIKLLLESKSEPNVKKKKKIHFIIFNYFICFI